MERDEARLVQVLGELSELGRRIGDRAGELARLLKRDRGSPPGLAEECRKIVVSVDRIAGAARVSRRSGSLPSRARPTGSRAAEFPRVSRGGVRRATRVASARGRRRSAGPAIASVMVHLVLLAGLATMFVAVEVPPARVALSLGEAAEPALEEFAMAEFAAPLEAETAAEAPATDAVVAEPEAPLDPMAADVPSVADAFAEAVETDFAVPDTGDLLAGVGDGGGRAAAAGAGGGPPARAAASFFGRSGECRSVCFVCDNSNSHRDGSFHAVLDEVARAIDGLRPEQSFFVIFTSDAAYPLFHPQAEESLVPATAENKRRLREWLGTVEMCRGGQGLDEAMRLAAALAPDVVYLLSDGALGGGAVERLASADFGDVVVHTFGVQQSVVDRRSGVVDPDRLRDQHGRNRNLAAIAEAHGGGFTAVSIPPAAAALEKLRPIPRNRGRGPVWGRKS